MAVTKTHPIKSTLKAAIDYILNPEKTDGKLLASSFGCGLETADIEFAWTREAAGDRGTHLGRHLIQSFAVGETTPEEAHKIGMELAGAVLGGKYEFVLTTHVDKDHLHNHLMAFSWLCDCRMIEAEISRLRIVAINFSNCGICPMFANSSNRQRT